MEEVSLKQIVTRIPCKPSQLKQPSNSQPLQAQIPIGLFHTMSNNDPEVETKDGSPPTQFCEFLDMHATVDDVLFEEYLLESALDVPTDTSDPNAFR